MSPTTYLQRVDIFISSPSDVSAEREIFFRVIEKLNRLPHIRAKYILMPLGYERDVPPTSGDVAQIIVNRYMTEAKDCYLCVCILWSRMGTPFTDSRTQKTYQSGTEYEFMSAYEAHEQHGEPHILLYRNISDNPNPHAVPNEKARVDAFFNRFEGAAPEFKGLYKTYSSLEAFETALFEHILQILHEHPPKSDDEEIIAIQSEPDLIEETRRLDAAMPRQIYVRQPTELWVQICLPDSDGFRSELPYVTKEGNVIDQKGVRKGNLAVVFPVVGGNPQPIQARVEIKAPDFMVYEAYRDIRLSPQKDSVKLVFALTPNEVRKRSIVHVLVTTKALNGLDIVLGSVSLDTSIEPVGVQLAAKVAWTILSVPLGMLATSVLSRSAGRQPDENNLIDNRQQPQQPVTPVVSPEPALSADDLMNIDPMKWLESLAARQGADPDELTTSADIDVPVPENVVIDEPGYFDYDPFGGTGKPAQPAPSGVPAPTESIVSTPPSTPLEDPLGGLDPLAWLESLASEQSPELADLLNDLSVGDTSEASVTEISEKAPQASQQVSSTDESEEIDNWVLAHDDHYDRLFADGDSIPDWYQDAASRAETTYPEIQPVMEQPTASTDSDLPDWLSAVSDSESEAVLPADIPDWLRNMSIASPEEPIPAAPIEETDWLRETAEPISELPHWLIEATAPVAPIPPPEQPAQRQPEPTPVRSTPAPAQPIIQPVPQPASPPAPTITPQPPPQEATPEYQSLLQQARQVVASNLSVGLNYYQALIDASQLLEEVRDDLQRLLVQHPKNARLHCLLGDVYMRLGDLLEALDIYRSALDDL